MKRRRYDHQVTITEGIYNDDINEISTNEPVPPVDGGMPRCWTEWDFSI